jgi:hypothetical protein
MVEGDNNAQIFLQVTVVGWLSLYANRDVVVSQSAKCDSLRREFAHAEEVRSG